jgi:hypothetical protein
MAETLNPSGRSDKDVAQPEGVLHWRKKTAEGHRSPRRFAHSVAIGNALLSSVAP